MDIHDLIRRWEKASVTRLAVESFSVQLPLYDAARIAALVEIFPLKSRQEIVSELLNVALDQVEEAFPYVQGERVIAKDDQGDPIFEDAGLTPWFLSLVKKHEARLASEAARSDMEL
ncbi:MAG: type 1 pili tip component [Gammaproteobacteria bacterium]|jgi:hypothetical protein